MKDLELGAQPTPNYQKPLNLGTEVIRGAAVSFKEITWILPKNKPDAEGAKKQPGGRPAPPPSTGRRAQVAWRQSL